MPLGLVLVLAAPTAQARLGAAVFAAGVAAMFGVSAVYHRVTWLPARRRWMARIDHATVYLLIAATYTPYGLLVLEGAWQSVVLGLVWAGAAAAIVVKWVWIDQPKWLSAVFGVVLGWAGIAAMPQIIEEIGIAAAALALAGGILYMAGAVIYARRRPDPSPAVFGYHELFHALVVGGAACQYAAVAFFVVPGG